MSVQVWGCAGVCAGVRVDQGGRGWRWELGSKKNEEAGRGKKESQRILQTFREHPPACLTKPAIPRTLSACAGCTAHCASGLPDPRIIPHV